MPGRYPLRSQGLGFIGDGQVGGHGRAERFPQQAEAEHLRGQGAPQPLALQRQLDFPVGARLFHRIRDRERQDAAYGMLPEAGDEPGLCRPW